MLGQLVHRLDALEPRPIGLIDPRVRGARLDLAARLYRRLALSKYCDLQYTFRPVRYRPVYTGGVHRGIDR